MHRNGSGSTVSRHQIWAEMPEHKVSMTLLHCRLVSKHRKVMHWRSSHWSRCWLLTQFHNWSTRSHKCRLTVRRWLVMLAILYGGLTWCIVQRGLALLDRVLLLRKIHLDFFDFFSRKNTQAMQDPPELIDVQVIGTVGSGIAFEEDSPGIFRAWISGRTLKQCRTRWSWSSDDGVDVPWKGSGILELHAVKTACDLDMSRSPFGGCVTMSQGPPWF